MLAGSQGRLQDRRPISIVDIGSNSIRLVVYEGLARSPTLLFNEKMLAGLGRGIASTGKLDPEEWAIMQTHAAIGASMLSGSPSPLVQLGEEIARTHHEQWDGSGYPAGLAGEEIPLAGRIVAICDVFDALRSKRPYKDAWTLDDALAEIARLRGRHFDPALTDLFLPLARELGGTVVEDGPSRLRLAA